MIGVRTAGARERGVFPLAGQDEDHGLAGEAVLFDGLGQQVEAGRMSCWSGQPRRKAQMTGVAAGRDCSSSSCMARACMAER